MHPLKDSILLGLEATSVIYKRLAKIAFGGTQSADEVCLMFSEKQEAMLEAAVFLTLGGMPMGFIDRVRERIAVNEARLSV